MWEPLRQWNLGADLLVNPVTQEGAITWSTYLPTGESVDVWTGESHEGGRVLERSVPIDVLPGLLHLIGLGPGLASSKPDLWSVRELPPSAERTRRREVPRGPSRALRCGTMRYRVVHSGRPRAPLSTGRAAALVR